MNVISGKKALQLRSRVRYPYFPTKYVFVNNLSGTLLVQTVPGTWYHDTVGLATLMPMIHERKK